MKKRHKLLIKTWTDSLPREPVRSVKEAQVPDASLYSENSGGRGNLWNFPGRPSSFVQRKNNKTARRRLGAFSLSSFCSVGGELCIDLPSLETTPPRFTPTLPPDGCYPPPAPLGGGGPTAGIDIRAPSPAPPSPTTYPSPQQFPFPSPHHSDSHVLLHGATDKSYLKML